MDNVLEGQRGWELSGGGGGSESLKKNDLSRSSEGGGY